MSSTMSTNSSGKYIAPHSRQQRRTDTSVDHSKKLCSLSSRWTMPPNKDQIVCQPKPSSNCSSRCANIPMTDSENERKGSVQKSCPPPVKIAFFGDSFVRMFGLLDQSDIMVRGFKGGSAKGLGRAGNKNRKAIQNFLESSAGQNVDRAVFVFGSVDVHLSFYHMKYANGLEIDLRDIAAKYVDFVADLTTDPSVTKTILGVYFSPLADADVAPSLASYGSLTRTQVLKVSEDDVKMCARQARVQAFNRFVKERCQESGVIQFEDINDEIADRETFEIHGTYKDISSHNIHLVWEPTLLVWLNRWAWLKALVPRGFTEGLQHTLTAYLKTKPWAHRVHISQEKKEAAAQFTR